VVVIDVAVVGVAVVAGPALGPLGAVLHDDLDFDRRLGEVI
jgi:hypothetical protein